MTTLAWTGSRPPAEGFTALEVGYIKAQFWASLARQSENPTVVSGGCLGVDAEITLTAHGYGLSTRALLPYHGVKTTAWGVLRKCHTEIVYTGKHYTERDKLIADEADEVRAIALYAPRLRPRSGTWTTARHAQRAGKLASFIILRPADGGAPRKYEVGAEWCLCPYACTCGLKPLEKEYA